MPTMKLSDIALFDPDVILPPAPEHSRQYWDRVDFGRSEARQSRVAFVAIARNAMPWLRLTIDRLVSTGNLFGDWRAFVLENDSTDDTKETLTKAARECDQITVRLANNGRPHLNGGRTAERTFALAEYRNECRAWVREHAPDYEYTVVFDVDSWGGWSINGLANSIGWLEDYENSLDDQDSWHQDWGQAAGMASYSWYHGAMPQLGGAVIEAHYDAWAARWNHWTERPEEWFHLWHPPVGSEPVRMNSAFGQLAIYRTRAYLDGVYRGGDCEHVSHWRTCGGDCYLNPSQRVVTQFIPPGEHEDAKKAEGGGMHSDLHDHVDQRNTD